MEEFDADRLENHVTLELANRVVEVILRADALELDAVINPPGTSLVTIRLYEGVVAVEFTTLSIVTENGDTERFAFHMVVAPATEVLVPPTICITLGVPAAIAFYPLVP